MPQVDRPAPSILDDESQRDLSPQNVTLDALKTFKCRHMLRIGALVILGHLTLQAATAVIVRRTRSAVVLVAQDFSPAVVLVAQDFSPAVVLVAQDFSPAVALVAQDFSPAWTADL